MSFRIHVQVLLLRNTQQTDRRQVEYIFFLCFNKYCRKVISSSSVYFIKERHLKDITKTALKHQKELFKIVLNNNKTE